jgi:hypothetical protein
MTLTEAASTTRAVSTDRRREPWRRLAERHGVTPRTLDRWAAVGIVEPPEYINGRKYGDPTAEPRRDPAREK